MHPQPETHTFTLAYIGKSIALAIILIALMAAGLEVMTWIVHAKEVIFASAH